MVVMFVVDMVMPVMVIHVMVAGRPVVAEKWQWRYMGHPSSSKCMVGMVMAGMVGMQHVGCLMRRDSRPSETQRKH